MLGTASIIELMPKLCTGCKHLMRVPNLEHSICKLFYKTSFITGEKLHVLAEEARRDPKMCGVDAHSYNEKKYPLNHD